MGGYKVFFMVMLVFVGFHGIKHGIISTAISLIIIKLLLDWLGWWDGLIKFFIDIWR